MRCDPIESRLDAHIDGELPPAETAELEAHLDACPACRRELESRRELRRICSGRPRVTAPPGLQDRILAAAAREDGDRAGRAAGGTDPRRWRRARWPLALAAAASLAVAVVLPALRDRRRGDGPAAPFATPAQVVVLRYGERAGQATPVRFGGIELGRTGERRP